MQLLRLVSRILTTSCRKDKKQWLVNTLIGHLVNVLQFRSTTKFNESPKYRNEEEEKQQKVQELELG